ncbi:MAG TPA: hypothetical protein VKV04_02925 [Verrucomicrobiae bacterium]|nr:hypothetical protein [Verrucomicrobiae bacterium]
MIKAACHVHSDWSYDGKWTLAELARGFTARGYRVLLMTEHDRGFTKTRLQQYREACAAASTQEILIVPGIEYSDAENVVHILTWGVVDFLGEGLPTLELLKKVNDAGGMAVFAHPDRKDAWKNLKPQWIKNLLGIEIWNRKTDGWAPGKTAGSLLQDSSLIPFVGIDFHTSRQFFPLAMELEMELPPTEESVLECLKSRGCRATALGRPLDRYGLGGWRRSGLRVAETGRRAAARAFRKLKLMGAVTK